jgi:hypothetical protein
MKIPVALLAFFLLIALFLAAQAKADTLTVTLDITETTVLNGTGFVGLGAPPLTWGTGYQVLTVTTEWSVPLGAINIPFPDVYGEEWSVVLNGGSGLAESICNYITQPSPNVFDFTKCPSGSLAAPFVSSVAESGSWGSFEMGFAGSEPIDIDANFVQVVETPEPSSFALTLLGLGGLLVMRKRMGRRTKSSPISPHGCFTTHLNLA